MVSDDDNILDSDSANPFEINARLYRDHHSCLQASRNSSGDPRRFVDHLDVDGDGVSEIVLEASGADAGAYLMVLSHQNGRWKETFRSPASWCLDARRH